MSFFKDLIKGLPASSSIASAGTSSSEFEGYINTGSYTLNAALSGSIFGGMPNNKITAFCGDPATGKTFFALGIMKQWQIDNPKGSVIYFDTESATTNKMMESQGVDLDRTVKVEPETIEQFRQTALQMLDRYAEAPEKGRPPMLMVLDSLGNMSSSKEMADIRDSKDTRDMTKAGLLKGTFRVLRLQLAKHNVAMIVNNHVYANVGNPYGPPKIISGGSGLIYVSDSIALLSKSKDKDKDKNIIGSIVKVKMYKSRLSKENCEAEVRIAYAGGLDRYHGLLDLSVEAGLVEHSAGKYLFPGWKDQVKAAKINENPGLYFTDEFLKKLDDEYIKPTFSYGVATPKPEPEEEEAA